MTHHRRPRVAFVCGNLVPAQDGVADYALRLAEALRVEVDPVLVTSGAVSDEATGALAVPVVSLGEGWSASGLRAVARALHRLRPDVVHVQFAPSAFGFSPSAGLLPAVTCRRARWVTTLHEYGWWTWPAWAPSVLWRVVERSGGWDRETLRLAPRSDAVVVTNAEHAETVRARLGAPAVTVPLAPNVVAEHSPQTVPARADAVIDSGGSSTAGSTERARAWLRSLLGARQQAEVIVFFGFVHPVKGVRYLLEAVAKLRDEYPDLHLVVVGGFASLALPGSEADVFRQELERRAHSLDIYDLVTFTGHLPPEQVSLALTGADACVLPFTAGVTLKSGALAAALSHGLPTVVTAADPPDPALVDGQSVVVVHGVRDSAPLAAGLRRLLADSGLRDAITEGGKALVAERTWPSVAAAHVELYRQVLGATS